MLFPAVLVAMMDIRVVRMLVIHHIVHMRMRVRFLTLPFVVVRMLVMDVMAMWMLVSQGRMMVPVPMPFAEMQPYPRRHQKSGHCQTAG